MECRLRKLTYMTPVTLDFTIWRNGVPERPEKGVPIGNMPIMVRSARCNLHPQHIEQGRVLHPNNSDEDRKLLRSCLIQQGEDPLTLVVISSSTVPNVYSYRWKILPQTE